MNSFNKYISFIIALVVIGIYSCEDTICLPTCINEIIEHLEIHHCDDSANIAQYRFQNEIVYKIDPGHCADDQSYDVIDSNCEVIGMLGGFAGTSKINGIDFYENAEVLSVVWER